MTAVITKKAPDEILAELAAMSAGDTDWRGGRVFSLVYKAGATQPAHEELVAKAHALYASTNLLNPMAFPSLRKLERELVETAAGLMNGPATVGGTVTSGGTESILVLVCALRDRARRTKPWIVWPELVVPATIHPAFDKAAHYFGVRLRKIAVGAELRADARAMAKAIGWRTIGVVASAPQYPHGVIDPITEIAAAAQRAGVPMHVDACVGGFVLPWLERLGRPVPAWDFRVPGVTSISADLHKFAYAGKGASLLLWRDAARIADQIFVATDFPGGIYASPTLLGTRPGGPVAAAWAALHALGDEGYLALTREAADAADRLRAGIAAISGLQLCGRGDATIVAYAAQDKKIDLYAVADRLEARGWTVDRQHRPASIHLTVTANHAAVVDSYLADLRAAVAEVRADPKLKQSGTAPMYGMAGKLPVRRLVARNVRKLIADMYQPGAAQQVRP